MTIWQRIDGQKSSIGVVAAGVLAILVEIGVASWEDTAVKVVAALIATWTGVAMNAKANKIVKAGNGG